jgi:hypothetical protein
MRLGLRVSTVPRLVGWCIGVCAAAEPTATLAAPNSAATPPTPSSPAPEIDCGLHLNYLAPFRIQRLCREIHTGSVRMCQH